MLNKPGPPKGGAGETAAPRSAGWGVEVQLVRKWLWRCLDEDILVPGYELCILDPCRGPLVHLPERGASRVERNDLRHTCGGPVVPVVPLKVSEGKQRILKR